MKLVDDGDDAEEVQVLPVQSKVVEREEVDARGRSLPLVGISSVSWVQADVVGALSTRGGTRETCVGGEGGRRSCWQGRPEVDGVGSGG